MIIATRILTLRRDGDAIPVPVRLHAPVQHESGCSCRYEIGWPDDPRDREGWGHDPMQAIILTLQMIGIEIYASGYHESGDLFWTEPGRGYGFPVPKPGREDLIGDDLRYDG